MVFKNVHDKCKNIKIIIQYGDHKFDALLSLSYV